MNKEPRALVIVIYFPLSERISTACL
uniref:Uncharacterized protein n=1 Tax=Anguilla anguilla TaxID=7936 RepID=A0A0E9U378_ANGAN